MGFLFTYDAYDPVIKSTTINNITVIITPVSGASRVKSQNVKEVGLSMAFQFFEV